MSYQVLARKWRPHTFEQVVGQHHVLTALTNALDQGRLHHAYLLSGTRGVGKTTIARILAKSLNCEQGISSHPCGVCDTCREIDQGNFVDLLATGGTVDATVKLIRRAGGEVADAAFIISLPSLGGDARLTAAGIKVVSLVELAGE